MTNDYRKKFLHQTKHEPRVLNTFIDISCINFHSLDAKNHKEFLDFLERQPDVYKMQRELLFKYLVLVLS